MALKIISCECDDANCRVTLKTTEEVFMRLMNQSDQRVIVDGCAAGAPSGEERLGRGNGYAIYACPTTSFL